MTVHEGSSHTSLRPLVVFSFAALLVGVIVYQAVRLEKISDSFAQVHSANEELEDRNDALEGNYSLLSDQFQTISSKEGDRIAEIAVLVDRASQLESRLSELRVAYEEELKKQEAYLRELAEQGRKAAFNEGAMHILKNIELRGGPDVQIIKDDVLWFDTRKPYYECSAAIAGRQVFSHKIWDIKGEDDFNILLSSLKAIQEMVTGDGD